MLKATPTYHKGINFIQISSLPLEQQELFQEWVPQSCIMEIKINNIVMDDCVEYQDYTYWFNFQFAQSNTLLDISL